MLALASPHLAGAAPNAAQGALTTWTSGHRSTGALVVRLTPTGSEVIASHAPDSPYMPASTMKIVTSAGALLAMGPDFRFRTRLLSSGNATVTNGVMRGTLYVRGAGDPLLSTGPYARVFFGREATLVSSLVRPLRRQGVRRHVGAIVVDGHVFDDRRSGLGWPSYYVAYCPPLSGASVNQNHIGDGRARYASDPDRSTGLQVVQVMARNGIGHRGAVRRGTVPMDAKDVAEVTSPPLTAALDAMNPASDNFIAETLRKGVGAYAGTAGTTAEGNRVTTTLLRDRGLMGPRDVLVDGSGLSRGNRLSATTLVNILAAAESEPAWGGALVTSLPTGGTGTLIRRFTEPGLRGRVHAKTGYINGVSSLAGVVASTNGERYAFAFLMNDGDIVGAKSTQDRIVRLLASGKVDRAPALPGAYTGPRR